MRAEVEEERKSMNQVLKLLREEEECARPMQIIVAKVLIG